MSSSQICPNETRSTQSGRVEAISGVGMFHRVFGGKSQKTQDIVTFFSLSQEKKCGEMFINISSCTTTTTPFL